MAHAITRRHAIRTLSALAATGMGSSWLFKANAENGPIWSLSESPYLGDRARILDGGEIIEIDNDDAYQLIADGKAQLIENFPPLRAAPVKKLNFESVLSSISPELENYFDYFICINTAQADHSPTNFVPAQSMTVIGRTSSGRAIFERNPHSGDVIGLTGEAQRFQAHFFESQLSLALRRSKEYARRNGINYQPQSDQLPFILPISSGQAAGGSILTFSGAFQINWSKTKNHQQSSIGSPMSHAMYIHYRYGSQGRWSGVALHGTPPSNWNKLGVSRASHGCVRTLPFLAEALRDTFINSKSHLAQNMPELNSVSVLPKQTGKYYSEPRPKVIMAIFEGYDRPNIYLG